LISALAGDLDADHGVASVHDRIDDSLDGVSQGRHAVPNGTAQMILNRDAAYLSETLIDLQIAAVGRKESETDWRGIVDQLQGWLLWKWRAKNR
jgi:hypothetical protein